MGEKEYIYYFTPERLDRFRYYHYLEEGQIVQFVIQYEREVKRNVKTASFSPGQSPLDFATCFGLNRNEHRFRSCDDFGPAIKP